MTTISVATLLTELEHWISCLTSVKSSLETQVSLLDSAVSHLHSSQPSSPAIHNIQSVHLAVTYQLSEVVRELSDLDLTRNLLATNIPDTGNSYEYLFRLSDRRKSLRHRANYYQGLSTLFDEIYTYLYQNLIHQHYRILSQLTSVKVISLSHHPTPSNTCHSMMKLHFRPLQYLSSLFI